MGKHSFISGRTTASNYGANGFVNSIETASESGVFNGNYVYPFAKNSSSVACTDTDSDGVPDIFDIDDDNDGVIDHTESSSCYFTVAEWNSSDKSNFATVSSDIIAASPKNDFTTLLDNVSGTDAIAFTANQSLEGKALFKVSFIRPVELISWYITKASVTQISGGDMMLQGSNDDATWTNLWTTASNPANTASIKTANGGVTLTNVNKYDVLTNKAKYQYYRLQNADGAATIVKVGTGIAREFYFDINETNYNPSFFPKSGTYSVDTDADGIPNNLDPALNFHLMDAAE